MKQKCDELLSNVALNFNLRPYIQALGVDVTVVDDGSVAVEKLVNERAEFNLAIFDISMPIMGGVEALRQVGGLLRTSTGPTLCSDVPSPRVCVRIDPEG